ncbi:uncharacterized protein MELLADRAFT_113952 [Melampsora larici-populina 98AG31]|uniref:Uncharacterized protein n=1 Tax=Melampsora larici-populina (strain 98AG31 / pathotype 3-4-7) TaxID=747676 RepID=F4SBM6_MELLP|nr:uncharacterized protein MELLADRAFT_113952 [Melampsora larici-populina 98AG31]EGF97958.1 hypothetical protein MELLADRAFT_113952 [Melampsora larici-populina 98AG31]
MGNSSSSTPSQSSANQNPNRSSTNSSSSWKPTPNDIFIVNELLKRKGNLPNELNYEILRLSEYWTEDEVNLNHTVLVHEDQKVLFDLDLLNDLEYMKYVFNGFQRLVQLEHEDTSDLVEERNGLRDVGLDGSSNRACKTLTAKVMKIEWKGWSSYPEDHGTYRNSWTWTEATLYDRCSQTPSLPSDHSSWYRVSTNVHARRQPTLHQSVWFSDHPFLLDLNQRLFQLAQSDESWHSIGFGLAAVAKFNGWENTIESMSIRIEFNLIIPDHPACMGSRLNHKDKL